MTQTIRLVRVGSPQAFIVQGRTHIGRFGESQQGQWAVPNREKPPEFDSLEAFIQIIDDTRVSRNHCALLPPDDLHDSFGVVDLNSRNGTSVNTSVQAGRLPLQVGDHITLGPDVEFVVEGLESALNYALLVGAGEDHLGAAQNDVNALDLELARRGYVTTVLTGLAATKQAVRDAIRQITYISVPDSRVFIYLTGHGGTHGFQFGRQILNPRELYQPLAQLRGTKAVIIDACNAGLFVDESNRQKIPQGTLVLTSSGVDHEAHETRVGVDGAGGVQYRSRFTNALAAYLRDHPERFNLQDFYADLQRIGTPGILLQEPMMSGASYTITSILQSRTDNRTP